MNNNQIFLTYGDTDEPSVPEQLKPIQNDIRSLSMRINDLRRLFEINSDRVTWVSDRLTSFEQRFASTSNIAEDDPKCTKCAHPKNYHTMGLYGPICFGTSPLGPRCACVGFEESTPAEYVTGERNAIVALREDIRTIIRSPTLVCRTSDELSAFGRLCDFVWPGEGEQS